MVWSHNDQWMVTGDHAGFIKYWQTNMNNVKMYQGHKEPIRSIRWEPRPHCDTCVFSSAGKLFFMFLSYSCSKVYILVTCIISVLRLEHVINNGLTAWFLGIIKLSFIKKNFLHLQLFYLSFYVLFLFFTKWSIVLYLYSLLFIAKSEALLLSFNVKKQICGSLYKVFTSVVPLFSVIFV